MKVVLNSSVTKQNKVQDMQNCAFIYSDRSCLMYLEATILSICLMNINVYYEKNKTVIS